MRSTEPIKVIGAGLAGSEAVWQIATLGVPVHLIEMKPHKKSPSHQLDTFAELVCSNSLRSNHIENAVGLLKEELRRLGSLVMESADKAAVPAGGALAVDRQQFSGYITKKLTEHPLITVIESEVETVPTEGIVVIATGPLTTEALSQDIAKLIGNNGLYFFDAAAPVIQADSIDMSKVFRASRYGKGTDDYLNCPMNKEEYYAFQQALMNAETVALKDFEENKIFEGCMPIESMSKRGADTMRFGPMKPVGLPDPKTGKDAHAIVQLRQDNAAASLFNMVGFQTHLKWGEQKRVFQMIPGLENAEFERFGVMHRNTYLNSPQILTPVYEMKSRQGLFFAGQMTGVEGYVESVASGWMAGINAAYAALGKERLEMSGQTVIGGLARYISHSGLHHFQPMNANFGLLDAIEGKYKDKKEKYALLAERSLANLLHDT